MACFVPALPQNRPTVDGFLLRRREHGSSPRPDPRESRATEGDCGAQTNSAHAANPTPEATPTAAPLKAEVGLSDARTGRVETFDDLGEAVRGAWMVIEAIPERLDLKRQVFGQIDDLADEDAILASNSSALNDVKHPERVLNTHYQQPPELNSVELMSSGQTDESLIEALMEKLPHYGLVPFRVTGCPSSPANCCTSTSTRASLASRAAAASTTTTPTKRSAPPPRLGTGQLPA